EDYPSLRESIDIVGAFRRDGIEDLDESSLTRYFCYFVKTSESQELLKLQLDYLLLLATGFQPEVDGWIGERDPEWSERWLDRNIGLRSIGATEIQEVAGYA
ncbi:MAG: hypothetical protein ACRERV_16940, partial [Methylococcales bacterium]